MRVQADAQPRQLFARTPSGESPVRSLQQYQISCGNLMDLKYALASPPPVVPRAVTLQLGNAIALDVPSLVQ